MRIALNGTERDLAQGATVADAAALAGVRPGDRGVAAALDGEVVPSAHWEEARVHEGARVEVVRAAAGG